MFAQRLSQNLSQSDVPRRRCTPHHRRASARARCGVLKKIEAGRRAEERTQQQIEAQRPQIEAYEAFCDELGEEPAAVALAWLLHQPAVDAPIVGPRTMEQLTGASLRALEIKLSDEELQKLDEIWPGFKTAPEHYAW